MSKPVIAVDIDDVLVQGTESLRQRVNDLLGINLSPEDYAVPGGYSSYYEQVWQAHGVADQIQWADLDAEMVRDQSHMLAVEGAYHVLKKLSRRYKLVVVTARNISWEPATAVWLAARYPNIFSGVYFAGDSTHSQSKGDLCKEVGADWLIDDNPDHAASALKVDVKVLLFGDYGWHKHTTMPENAVRCKDWAAVQEYFDGVRG